MARRRVWRPRHQPTIEGITRMRHRRIVVAAGAILVFVAGWGAVSLWRASRVLRASEQQTENAHHIAFTEAALDRTTPAGWETFAAPSGFRDAAILNGHLFVAGGAGAASTAMMRRPRATPDRRGFARGCGPSPTASGPCACAAGTGTVCAIRPPP